MSCDICFREYHPQRLPFLCPVDARNRIYEPRLTHAHALLENEALASQIATHHTTAPSSSDLQSQRTTVEDSTSRILAAAETLRSDIQDAREEVKKRREELLRRKRDLREVREGLAEKRGKMRGEVERSMGMKKLRWAQDAESTAESRRFLCLEAARLFGLRRVKGAASGGGKYGYVLGKVPVVELASMNALAPEVISTSLAHISHMLILSAYYLAIRLPAELILPHRDHPRPTIFNLASSYVPHAPTSTSTSTSSSQNNDVPRPRPLFIDRPLAQLAKEDPTAYSFFLEGVTLLAYNVAWLCCSQGVQVSERGTFEEVCQMGKNLYSLLISQQATGPHATNLTAPASDSEGPQQPQQEKFSWLGRYSHGSTFYSLASADGNELVRTFRLPAPIKLADKLRRKLMGDAPDWEVLDDDAWKMEDGDMNAIGGISGAQNGGLVPKGAKMVKGESSGTDNERPKASRGESQGWMKLKSRS